MRDMPEGFGGEYGVSVIDPLGFLILAICCGYILSCKRSAALIPLLVIATVLPQSLRIVVASIDFSMVRLVVVAGLLRLFIKGEFSYFRYTTADKLLVAFLIVKSITATVLHGSMSVLIQEIGFSLDAAGTYFIARCTVRTFEDLQKPVLALAIITCLISPLYLYEYFSSYNLFSIFKGVQSEAWERDGEIRARGALPHAILAGCFFATFVPLFIAHGLRRVPWRLVFLSAIFAVFLIVASTSSSTPAFSFLSALFGWCVFLVRKKLALIRTVGIIFLVILHFAMNAPIWHLISRFSFSASSTGYFRFMLIDSFIKRANEWFVIGTKYTGHWFFGAQDITNQFVLVGVRGGIIPLIIFVAQILFAFRYIGSISRFKKDNKNHVFAAWGLGVSLLVHLTNFIGVSYFGQIIVLWYALLGIISSLEFSTRLEARSLERSRDASAGN
jgi:hypothetical protein